MDNSVADPVLDLHVVDDRPVRSSKFLHEWNGSLKHLRRDEKLVLNVHEML